MRRAVAFAALGAGLLLVVVRRLRQRAAVSRLADELGAVPDALARAFGDPTVEVAYRLPAAGRYVDSEGRNVDRPMPTTTRAVTPIVRGGSPVAVVYTTRDSRPRSNAPGRLGGPTRDQERTTPRRGACPAERGAVRDPHHGRGDADAAARARSPRRRAATTTRPFIRPEARAYRRPERRRRAARRDADSGDG